jgi:hypothetical protein
MVDNISMTRIADLPDSNSITSMAPPNIKNDHPSFNETSNIYIPLNPHPNPYGITEQQQGGVPPPAPTQQQFAPTQQQFAPTQQQFAPTQQQPEYRLPQRDIPMDITEFTHDEQIQANYIPKKPKLTTDYVQRHEEATKSKIREYEEEQRKEANTNQWIELLYQPILLGILYFIFQLPLMNTLIFKRFSFLSIYKADGNFNVVGLVLKSVLFASVFFLIHQSTNYLIDLF